MPDLAAIAAKANTTEDGVLNYVRFNLALAGTDPDQVKEVVVKPLPQSLKRKLEYKVFAKACYHNTYEALKALKGAGEYVLGYWHQVIPVEHCFLKIGDDYYDPTGEIVFGDKEERRYFAAFEMSCSDVKTALKRNKNWFPDIYHYLRNA